MLVAAPVPPIGAEPLLRLLLAVAVLLFLAHALGRLAERVGLPAIVGELLTGVVLGPSLLGHLAPGFTNWLLPPEPEQMHMLDAIGQIGLLLLVALTGTHVDTKMIRRRGRTAAAVSLGGLLIPLGLGIGLGVLLTDVLAAEGQANASVFPLFLGVAMCVTAIPVIAKTLTDMGMLHRNVGQLTLAAGMVDDAVGWLLLSIVSAAATTGLASGHIALPIAAMAAFVLLAAVVGRPLVRRLMTWTARSSATPGPTVATAVLIVLLGSVSTHSLGMEPIFGAFVAGILIATAGHEVQTRLAPLRTVVLSVLAPLFIATAGLRMDLTALADPGVAGAALAVLAVAIAGKFVGAYLGARLSRLSHWEGLALGAGMNSRGVVEVIVALTGLRLGVLDTAGYTVIVLVAIVTSLMAPPTLRFAMARIEQDEDERLRRIDHETWQGQRPAMAAAVEEQPGGAAEPDPDRGAGRD